MKKIYNVMIIGAGNIGAFFDKPESQNILTHAHAFSAVENTKISCFVDVDQMKAQKAASLWGGEAYKSISDAFSNHKIDIVCITVPDEYHCSILKEVINYQAGMIFTEKPLAKNLMEADEIIDIFSESGKKVAINYSRRFIPEFSELRENISKNKYGNFLTGTLYYGKGIIHNGSHGVDLIRYLLGCIADKKVYSGIYDYYPDDPSVSGVLKLKNGGSVNINPVDCRAYTIFELDLFFEAKRIKLVDSGFKVKEFDIIDSGIFAGYKVLSKAKTRETALGNSLYFAAKNIVNHLECGDSLKCTLYDGYETLKICSELKAGLL